MNNLIEALVFPYLLWVLVTIVYFVLFGWQWGLAMFGAGIVGTLLGYRISK